MSDLISRAAALEVISAVKGITWSQSGKVLCGKMYSQIKELPAVDAAPVVHARWKAYCVPHWTKRYDDNGDPEYKYHNEYVCSICGRRTIVKENYCPACGAKMDGDT